MRPLTDEELYKLWDIQNCTNFHLIRGSYQGEEAAYIAYQTEDGLFPVAKLLTPSDYPHIKGPPGLEHLVD